MKKQFRAHIITQRCAGVTTHKVDGWGDHAHETVVEGGRVMQLAVSLDGKLQFEFHIDEEGTVTFTDQSGMSFSHYISGQLRLKPTIKWKK